ncbi:endonuclease [Flavobacteriaceae bacterium AU392]|nr:endonuclease [Flavobacteriaceae bacterium]RKM83666.1 endonuclease [Flavobacteriaceae bacterium AU392]
MKKLNTLDKLVFFFNLFIAIMLLFSYVLPYVQPKNFAFLSVLSLGVPLLIVLNILFLIYWLLKVKKHLLISLIVLIIGSKYVTSLYKFSSSKDIESTDNISLMNYNVRLFNLYNWIPSNNTQKEIVNLIKEAAPEIISFQEYHPHADVDLSFYKYKYESLSGSRIKYGQAIFSKYPIIDSGSVKFPSTANNAIYADIVKDEDTLRIYNVHLQSLRIQSDLEQLQMENSDVLIEHISDAFEIQQSQAELFIKHKSKSPYRVIVCGDFNNTPYSYVYDKIKGDLKDAFQEAGNGFGRTFDFKYFPTRIDFILTDPSYSVNSFKTYKKKLSDHYPIMAKVSLHK